MIKVLIVDDDKLARKGLISIVPWENCGMEVVGEAANGQRALEFIAENHVDLAVVDLAMPVMTGLVFIEESKKRFPHLHYVVLSFHEDFQNVQSALRLGTLDYISKMRLDQQDCAEVFHRVGKLILTDDSVSYDPETSSATECTQWVFIQQDWLEFRWLYTEYFLGILEEETMKYRPSLRQIDHLLVRIADMSHSLFPFFEPSPIPPRKDIDTGFEWIRAHKQALSDTVLREQITDSTITCMLKAVDYVRIHIHESISMKQAATAVSLSRSYFSANFKKTVGLTFNSFLRMERIDRAKEILKSEQLSAGELAQRVGYEDEKYFLQVFYEHTGKTLTAYLAEN